MSHFALKLVQRDIKENKVSASIRYNGEKLSISESELETKVEELLEDIQNALYERAKVYLENHIKEVRTIEELEQVLLVDGGYAKMMWSGDLECLDVIKEKYSATARCLPFDQTPFTDKCLISERKQNTL